MSGVNPLFFFKFLGFKIEISSNIKIVNFLDVTLDLSNNSYKPFIKSNQNPSYINVLILAYR